MSKMNTKLKWGGIIAIVLALVAAITGAAININTENGNVKADIIYSDEPVESVITDGEEIEKIETGRGEVFVDGEEIKTVEAIDNNGPVVNVESQECPEGEECGRGANYPQLDISSPQAFANATLGRCIDVDGYYGAQCWDLMAAFWYNYTGRTLSTCGTGAAKGAIADGCWQINAGNEFTMIWDRAQVQAGDIAFYSTGAWGHTAMAMGTYNNGYFTVLGENQGGAACPGGGGAANIINLSTRDFIGAFRPNIYIKPEPEPEPEPEPAPEPEPIPAIDVCEERVLVWGDTLGKIMLECEGKVEWGEAMNAYARSWVDKETGVVVFDGWSTYPGVGLYAGHVIVRR